MTTQESTISGDTSVNNRRLTDAELQWQGFLTEKEILAEIEENRRGQEKDAEGDRQGPP